MILTVTMNPCVDRAMRTPKMLEHDTNRVTESQRDAGGKGISASRIVARLGGCAVATGFLGGATGEYVRRRIEADGVVTRFVEVAGETRENLSVEDDSDEPPTTFNEAGPVIETSDTERLFAVLEAALPEANWLAIGGSIPRGIGNGAYAELIEFARKFDVPVALDADGELFSRGLDARPRLIKPNLREAQRALGRSLTTPAEIESAAAEIRCRLEPHEDAIAIISLGEDGAVMATRDGVYRGICPCVEVRSTVGCGDSMVGGVLWGLDQGFEPELAFRWGLAAAASTAESNGSDIGTATVARARFESTVVERR